MQSWHVTHRYGDLTFIDYFCPACKTITNWECHGQGKVPVARCCNKAEKFPIDDPKFAAAIRKRRSPTQDTQAKDVSHAWDRVKNFWL